MDFYFRKSKTEKITDDSSGVGSFFIEVLKVAVVSLAIIVPVRYFLIQPFVVRGSSMETNFSSGDYLIIDEISYRFSQPQRGDTIVFKYPKNPAQYYIKRIIGLPGERVQISDGGVIVYNGAYPGGIELEEFYLAEEIKTPGNIDQTLGSDEYFVLGDNRDASSDSRVWGPVPKKLIVGRSIVRLWPFNKIGLFPGY